MQAVLVTPTPVKFTKDMTLNGFAMVDDVVAGPPIFAIGSFNMLTFPGGTAENATIALTGLNIVIPAGTTLKNAGGGGYITAFLS